jgi:chromosomal replication initiator protein
MNEIDSLWNKVLSDVELTVSKANFTTWFKDTGILKLDDGVIHIGVPNAFVKDWLFNKYHKTILKSLREASNQIRSLEYIIVKDEQKKKELGQSKKNGADTHELPLGDLYINKDDNLNPKYTFDSFVVGPFNELAYAASQAVIKNTAFYNPLFFYGSTGRGKTHLIQAIGNYVKKENPQKKVFYMSSDKFYHDYSVSMQEGKINAFKEKYKKYDVFMMDDIQFLSKKEKTQEELFHLFDYLHGNNKQIIFSSDQHPNYIQDLEDRLKSRFVSGMIVDIPAPDYESRAAIIRNKLAFRSFSLPDHIIEYIAGNLEANIRELEGALNSIIVQTKLKGKDLDIGDIKALIKHSGKPQKSVSISDVIKVVSKYYNIEEAVLKDKTRKKEVVIPRQMAMYILREDYDMSFPFIGEKLGGRDHTTVMHSCDKIKQDLKDNNQLVQELTQIRAMF